MGRPGQVLTKVNPEGPEAVVSLSLVVPLRLMVEHPFPCSSLSSIKLLGFADVEMKVVVTAPRCQASDLLSVGRLIAIGV